MTEQVNTFPDWLRVMREALQIPTQSALHALLIEHNCEITPKAVSKWHRGQSKPLPHHRVALLRIFGLSSEAQALDKALDGWGPYPLCASVPEQVGA